MENSIERENSISENRLGQEKISKLLKMYAIPSIISILVNALYNIVDQVFIGWGVGYLANGATNVVFPITIVFASFALMFGDGSAAYLSLKLGEGHRGGGKRSWKWHPYVRCNFHNLYSLCFTVSAMAVKCVWMYSKSGTICERLWIYYCDRSAVFHGRHYDQFRNPGRRQP